MAGRRQTRAPSGQPGRGGVNAKRTTAPGAAGTPAARQAARKSPGGTTPAGRTPSGRVPASRVPVSSAQGGTKPAARQASGKTPAGQRPAGRARPGPAAAQQEISNSARLLPQAPGWLQYSTLILSLAGLADAIYLTIAHLTTSAILACSGTGLINCAKVTTSAQSHFLGLPVSELGLAFFVFMVAVNTPWAWRARQPAIYWARLGSVVVGMIFVLWLVYAELVIIRNICLFCTGVHVITFLLFALLMYYASIRPSRRGL